MTEVGADLPFLSVVIPTRDRPVWLARCLEGIAAQCYPSDRLEVTVCDDASQSDLSRLIAGFRDRLPNLRWTRLSSRRGPAAARNAGWSASRGDIIVFLDDDVIPADGHFSALSSLLTRSERTVAGVEGKVVPGEGAEPGLEDPLVHTLRLEGGGHSCNIAYRRAALELVSGFDEGFPHPACEDFDLFYRVTKLAGEVIYEPRMLAYHAVEVPPLAWHLARRRDARFSNLRLFLKHPDRFPPPWLQRRLPRLFRFNRRPSLLQLLLYFIAVDASQLAHHRGLLFRDWPGYGKLLWLSAADLWNMLGQAPKLRQYYGSCLAEFDGLY